MKRVVLWSMTVAAVAVLGYACLAALGPTTNPDTTVRLVGDVAVAMETQPYTADVGGVGLRGTLTVLPGGCVGFTGRDHVLLVFPPGTTVGTDPDGEVVIDMPAQGELRIGDQIETGTRLNGGPVPLDELGDLADQVPPACRRYHAYPIDE